MFPTGGEAISHVERMVCRVLSCIPAAVPTLVVLTLLLLFRHLQPVLSCLRETLPRRNDQTPH